MERRAILRGGVAAGLVGIAGSAPLRAAEQGRGGPPPRRRELLDTGWRFHLGHAADVEKDFGFGRNQRTYAKAGWETADASATQFEDQGWAQVRVPHDWAIDLPYAPPKAPVPENRRDAAAAHGFKAIGRDFPANSIGWYRRALDIAPEDAGRSIWIEFDGVFRDCIVFVNGYVAGRQESGYAPFRVDIGDFLEYGGQPNVLTVRCDASLGEGWFYEGAGIYRDVWLVRTGQVHVPQWGTFVRADVAGDAATLNISVEIANRSSEAAAVVLRQHLLDPDGRRIGELSETALELAPESQIEHHESAPVAKPRLWSVATPHLYTLVSEVALGETVVDRYETPFGIRTIAFDAARGFLLNGVPTKLLGVCNHHDHAGVGVGIPRALHDWRVATTKEMGANAWRSAHNPAAEALLDACDRQGMLMIDEARRNSSDPQAMRELDTMIRRGRNHPCIIAWSMGNEEPHQSSPRGARIVQEMVRHSRALDPTRPTTQAFDNGFEGPVSASVDVIGFNYRTDKIAAFHAKRPGQPVIGSETGSTVSTRGEYFNDAERQIVRAYDTEHPWWASTAEQWWTIAAADAYVAGGFIWTGFDYRGEPTPYPAWPSASSYFGVMDLCGFAKDNYWYYRAWWRSEPIVHLFPHWNWAGKEGEKIPVWAHSNCDQVELWVNGKSAGRRTVERNRHVAWDVPFAPDAIEARGYRGGREVASARRETTGAPSSVRLIADRRTIAGDGRDVAMLRAEVVDAKGRVVPNASNMLTFDVAGPGQVIGVGNGDPTSHEPDRAARRSAFNGLAQAILQSRGPGAIRVTASAQGLKPGMVAIGAAGDAK